MGTRGGVRLTMMGESSTTITSGDEVTTACDKQGGTMITVTGAIVGLLAYLKQSPVPPSDDTIQP